MSKNRFGESTYSRRRHANVCVWCGSPDLATRQHCEEHRKAFNAHTAAGAHRRTRERRERRHAAGLCVQCGREAVTRRHCEEHRVIHNAYVRASIARRADRRPKAQPPLRA